MHLAHHDVNRGRGLYYLLEKAGRVDGLIDDATVELAMRESP